MQTLNNIKVRFKDPEQQPSQVRSAFEQKIKSVRNPSGPFTLDKAYDVIAITDPAASGVQRVLITTDSDEFAWIELEWLLYHDPAKHAALPYTGKVVAKPAVAYMDKVVTKPVVEVEKETEPSISEETNDSVEAAKRGRKPKNP